MILSPATAPPGGSRISTLSGELAHMTMAWDTTPLILAGFRLHSRMAMRFCICTETPRCTFTALRTNQNKAIVVYLVQRYVLDQSTDHSPGRRLPHVHLLHVQTVGVRVLLGFDYTSYAQIQARHVHLGFLLARGGLFLLCFISPLCRRNGLNLYFIHSKRTERGKRMMGTMLDICLDSD